VRTAGTSMTRRPMIASRGNRTNRQNSSLTRTPRQPASACSPARALSITGLSTVRTGAQVAGDGEVRPAGGDHGPAAAAAEPAVGLPAAGAGAGASGDVEAVTLVPRAGWPCCGAGALGPADGGDRDLALDEVTVGSAGGQAFELTWPDELRVFAGRTAESGAPRQPLTDAETIKGARNRSIAALEQLGADYGVGIEGGLQRTTDKWFAGVWVVIIDKQGQEGVGAALKVAVTSNVMRSFTEDLN
jgi:Protein of unknown function DUF84